LLPAKCAGTFLHTFTDGVNAGFESGMYNAIDSSVGTSFESQFLQWRTSQPMLIDNFFGPIYAL